LRTAFVMGNVWLFAALILFLGADDYTPVQGTYRFLGVGGWHYASTYNALIGACVIAAVICFAAMAILRITKG